LLLYKYLTFDGALKVIKNSSISFTKAHQFNDLFEMEAISSFSSITDDSNPEMIRKNIETSKLKGGINMSYGVLSLTRNPLNNLMWSHYGDEHRGVVIGINIEEAGFCDPQKNVIPAQFGDVIYTKTFPRAPTIKITHSFNELRTIKSHSTKTYDFLKYAYLFKGIDWAYEEEIRVVKNVGFHIFDPDVENNNYYTNTNGSWRHVKASNYKDYNLFKFPISSVKEIYFGAMTHDTSKINEILSALPNIQIVRSCAVRANSYEITSLNYFGEKT
jgi:hypothetical protein